MRIRRLEARDKPQWLALFKAYIAFYRATVTDEIIELTWQRMLAGEPDFHIGLVAVDDEDRAFGLAHMLLHRSTWSATHYCYLEDLFVDPARRQAGAGRALIAEVYRLADAMGCTRTFWVTEESNATARKLYDQMASKTVFVQYRR